MTIDPEVPEYRVLQTVFIAPHIIFAGSRIATFMEPHNGLAPLNDSARAALERWYDKECDELDEKFKKTGKKLTPNAQFRPLSSTGEVAQPDQPEFTLLALPPKDMPGKLSLAEIGIRPSTDQRPGPAVPVSYEGETVVIEVAPRPKKVA